MNLKEAFRYQNKLGSLMDEAQSIDVYKRQGLRLPLLLVHH